MNPAEEVNRLDSEMSDHLKLFAELHVSHIDDVKELENLEARITIFEVRIKEFRGTPFGRLFDNSSAQRKWIRLQEIKKGINAQILRLDRINGRASNFQRAEREETDLALKNDAIVVAKEANIIAKKANDIASDAKAWSIIAIVVSLGSVLLLYLLT